MFRIHERLKVTRYRSILPRLLCVVGTPSPFAHLSPSSTPRSPPRVASSLHTRSTCTRHLNIRASPAHSGPSPLLCVNCIIFTPNTVRSPVRRAPRPPGSTGQIAHVHRKSPPGTVSQPHVASPRRYPKSGHPATPYLTHVGLPFFPKVTYIRTWPRAAPRRATWREIHDPIRELRAKSRRFCYARDFSGNGEAGRRRRDEVWRT